MSLTYYDITEQQKAAYCGGIVLFRTGYFSADKETRNVLRLLIKSTFLTSFLQRSRYRGWKARIQFRSS
jgi:hypothetical protein